MKNYTDADYAVLVWETIWGYLAKGAFKKKFGAKLTVNNLVAVISKVIPDLHRLNKDNRNMQPFKSHYNMVSRGERKKDVGCNCNAEERAREIIYVFAIKKDRVKADTVVPGLYDHLSELGYGDLLELAETHYKSIDEQREEAYYMHDAMSVLQKEFKHLDNKIELLSKDSNEVLSLLKSIKSKELSRLNNDIELQVDEIIREFENTPDNELRNKIYKFINSLKKI